MGIFNYIFSRGRASFYPPVMFDLDLRNRLPRCDLDKLTVLNVGVGVGNSGLAMQLPYFKFKRLDCIDVHEPYLNAALSRTWATKDVNFLLADIRDFGTARYDIVLMFDILEHLPKEDAFAVMDKIKCKQFVFIPLEEEFRSNVFGAESQDHLSLWTEEDFKNRGYVTQVLKDFHKVNGKVFSALWAKK